MGCHSLLKGSSRPRYWTWVFCFPDSSVGKEYACNARDPSSIPGSGGSPGKGIGYPLQYSWASLLTQLVKNLPAMWETSVRSLGWEDHLEKGKATHSSILAWRIPWTIWSMGSQTVGRDWDLNFHSCIASRFFTIQATREASPPEEIATEILIIL